MTKERLIDLIEEEISYLSDTSKLGTYISEAVSGKPENLRTMIEEGHLNPLEISGVFSKIDKIKETLKGGGSMNNSDLASKIISHVGEAESYLDIIESGDWEEEHENEGEVYALLREELRQACHVCAKGLKG